VPDHRHPPPQLSGGWSQSGPTPHGKSPVDPAHPTSRGASRIFANPATAFAATPIVIVATGLSSEAGDGYRDRRSDTQALGPVSELAVLPRTPAIHATAGHDRTGVGICGTCRGDVGQAADLWSAPPCWHCPRFRALHTGYRRHIPSSRQSVQRRNSWNRR
jgi:hypothetical protein